jgi:hypothetical protein
VQFGNGLASGGRWLARIGLACLVLAAVAGVAVRGAGQHQQHAANTSPPAVRVIAAGHPLLGVTAGWELFARGSDDLLRIRLAQGKISVTYVPPLRSANPNVVFVIGRHEAVIRSSDLLPGYVVPDGGHARLLTGPLAGDSPLIPGLARAQAAWIDSGSPTSPDLSLVSLTGRRVGPTIRFRPDGPQAPANAVADGRGYVLVTTGSFSVYDAGPGWDRPLPGTVLAVGRASWLVMACDALHRHCRYQVVDTAGSSRRVLPGQVSGYRGYFSWPPTGVIAPDGRTAAVAESGRDGRPTVHLINLRSGASRDLNVLVGTPGKVPLGADLNDQSMVWSPDSRWLFVAAAGGKLVAVDARTGRAQHLWTKLPAVDQVAIRPLLRPAQARPWLAADRRQAAVDRDDCAGEVSPGSRRQEQGSPGHVIRLPDPA